MFRWDVIWKKMLIGYCSATLMYASLYGAKHFGWRYAEGDMFMRVNMLLTCAV